MHRGSRIELRWGARVRRDTSRVLRGLRCPPADPQGVHLHDLGKLADRDAVDLLVFILEEAPVHGDIENAPAIATLYLQVSTIARQETS